MMTWSNLESKGNLSLCEELFEGAGERWSAVISGATKCRRRTGADNRESAASLATTLVRDSCISTGSLDGLQNLVRGGCGGATVPEVGVDFQARLRERHSNT